MRVPGLDDVGAGRRPSPRPWRRRGGRRRATTSSIRPAALAAAGASILPSRSRGAAAIGPIIRTRRVVPPAPGKMPIRISGRPIFAPSGVSAMKRRWQASAISVPMPAERPGRAQATGLPPFRVFGSMPARSIFRSSRCMAMMPSKRPRAGVVAGALLHAGEEVEVHAAGEVGLGAGDDDALDGGVGEGGVDGGVEVGDALLGQDVHRLAGQVPGDGGDAVGVDVGGEDRHGLVSLGAVASRRSAAGRLCGQKERAGARIVSLLVFGLLAENDCSPGFKAV